MALKPGLTAVLKKGIFLKTKGEKALEKSIKVVLAKVINPITHSQSEVNALIGMAMWKLRLKITEIIKIAGS